MLKHKYDDVEHDNDDQGDQGNDDHADDRVNCMAWLMMMRVVGLERRGCWSPPGPR